MVDFFLKTRLDMIDNLQTSLRAIRQLLELSAQDLGELIGLTRQTINNLETKKSQMTPTQYVSLCAVIDNMTTERPEILSAIIAVLNSNGLNAIKGEALNVHNASFLKRWFLCFPHEQINPNGLVQFTNENYDDLLNVISQNYKIFVDLSSLMSPGITTFFAAISPKLVASNSYIIIQLRVIEQIQKRMLSSNYEESQQAQVALSLLSEAQNRGIVQIRGEASDSNIYSTFISVFAKYKTSYRLFLITQDVRLARDVLSMNRKEAMEGFPISTGFLSDGGILKSHGDANEYRLSDIQISHNLKEDNENVDEDLSKGWDSIE